MPASCYLTTMVDNCVPQRQLGSCSVTRPFLSLQRVWLARLHDLLIALYVDLNEAVAQLVRVTQGYTFISSVSYVCFPQQYVAHFHIDPDGAFIKAYQADVSMDFHPRLGQPPKVKFYARVSSRTPFLYLKNKQPNL